MFTRPREAALIAALDSHHEQWGHLLDASLRSSPVEMLDGGLGCVAVHSELIWLGVLGQWLPLLVIPTNLSWPAYCAWVLLAFVLFRFFDITKIGPIGMAEKIAGGAGVMADDLVAGVFAGIIVLGSYHLWQGAGF